MINCDKKKNEQHSQTIKTGEFIKRACLILIKFSAVNYASAADNDCEIFTIKIKFNIKLYL